MALSRGWLLLGTPSPSEQQEAKDVVASSRFEKQKAARDSRDAEPPEQGKSVPLPEPPSPSSRHRIFAAP